MYTIKKYVTNNFMIKMTKKNKLITLEDINKIKYYSPKEGDPIAVVMSDKSGQIIGYPLNDSSDSTVKIGLFSIIASCYDEEGGNYGIIIQITTNHDNRTHRIFFTKLELLTNPKVFHRLIDRGFAVPVKDEPGIKCEKCDKTGKAVNGTKIFSDFLARHQPENHIPYVTNLGYKPAFHGYSFPEGIYLSSTESSKFQPKEIYYPAGSENHPSKLLGTYQGWQSNVADKATEGAIPSFVLMYSMASMLLPFTDLGTLFLHLWGKSSCGKSLMLQLAGSIYGSGVDPRVDNGSMIQKWNTTALAIQTTAAKFDGSLLLLDEIGECDDKEFQNIIYQVNSGVGKARVSSTGEGKETSSWKLLGVSSGELSGFSKLAQGGVAQKEGEAVRFLDIHIKDQIFPGEADPAAFVESLKEACGKEGGHASRVFISQLLAKAESEEALSKTVMQDIEKALAILSEGNSFDSLERRVMRHFALVAVAGKYAVEFGILKLTEEVVYKVVKYVRDIWLSHMRTKFNASYEGMLRSYIINNLANFVDTESEHSKQSCAGYKGRLQGGYFETNIPVYLIEESNFKGIFKELNLEEVCHKLAKDKVLSSKNDQFQFNFKIRSDHGREERPFYCIAASILGDDSFESIPLIRPYIPQVIQQRPIVFISNEDPLDTIKITPAKPPREITNEEMDSEADPDRGKSDEELRAEIDEENHGYDKAHPDLDLDLDFDSDRGKSEEELFTEMDEENNRYDELEADLDRNISNEEMMCTLKKKNNELFGKG